MFVHGLVVRGMVHLLYYVADFEFGNLIDYKHISKLSTDVFFASYASKCNKKT